MARDRSRISSAADDRRLIDWLVPPFWVISDTHFHHDNVVGYTGRPADHDELMVERWMETVGEDDWVVHLGDVALGKREQFEQTAALLPGRKLMIWGNHDHRSAAWYLERGFEMVLRGFELDYRGWRILFSHRPDTAGAFVRYPRRLNVHGHVHDIRLDDRRLINVSVEQIDYTPQPISAMLDARIDELTAGKGNAHAREPAPIIIGR